MVNREIKLDVDRPVALTFLLWHWSEKDTASPKYTDYMFKELLQEHLH